MIQVIILIAVSLFVVIIALINVNNYKKITATGIEAEGIIFDMDYSPSTGGSDSTTVYPVVRFLTDKNEWITQKASVSLIPGSYKKGQPVTVVYLKDKPTEFFIKSGWTNAVLSIMIIIGTVLFAYGVYLLINL